MMTEGRRFYSQSALTSFTRQDILEGRVIKINPALITITDGLVESTPPETLQPLVETYVGDLLDFNVRTFHVDINFPDYSSFGPVGPDINTKVFTPAFLACLNDLVRSRGAFLNLHLLTDHPRERLREFAGVSFGAVCFQLDAVNGTESLSMLVDDILETGACVSPVIETVGAGQGIIRTKEEVLDFLKPVLSRVGMLTFQAAGTASRSSSAQGTLALETTRSYIEFLQPALDGTIQLQGGVKTETVGKIVQLGAEFLVCGTEIFRHPADHTPEEVIAGMLQEAARALV